MKTASLGLLEVPVVRVNAGGMPPPGPPSVGDVRGHSPFLVFFKKVFWRISGKIYLAGRPLRYNYKKPHQSNGGLSSTCMHVRA